MKKSLISIAILLSLFTTTLVSAQSITDFFYYNSPLDLLSTEGFTLLIIGAVIFFVVNYSLSKTELDKATRLVITIAITFLATLSIRNQVGIGFGFQQNVGAISLLVVFLLAISFIVHLLLPKSGILGPMVFLLIVWLINNFYDLYYIMPYAFQTRTIDQFLFLFSSPNTFYILGIITLALFAYKWHGNKKDKIYKISFGSPVN